MHRLSSGGWLFALLFSTAHTPTIQLQRGAASEPESSLHATLLDAAAGVASPTMSYWESDTASLPDAWLTAALQRDFADDDAIKRFMLDDFHLPSLDVSLPALFDWSDPYREYLADNRGSESTAFTYTYALDSALAASFPGHGLGYGAHGGGMAGGLPSVSGGMRAPSSAGGATDTPANNGASGDETGAGSNTPDTADTPDTPDTSNTPAPGTQDGNGNSNEPGQDSGQHPGSDNPNPGTLPPIYGGGPGVDFPIEPTPPPVQVPAPGSLGLFALGLAGLCVANRRKQPKRLAAT